MDLPSGGSGQKPSIDFPNGVEDSKCGLIADVGIWEAEGTLTGDLSNYRKSLIVETESEDQVKYSILCLSLMSIYGLE